MKERILEFLRNENKSSAQLAEEIGVQASGISHILSGRNNPSLDFILKMLEKYQFLSTDWLLFGKGSMYKDIRMQNLFDVNNGSGNNDYPEQSENKPYKPEPDFQNSGKDPDHKAFKVNETNKTPVVEKIVWFYDNNSFEEYYPGH
jgi:transcriptional regulator with XRE-family HTH domain